MPNLFTTHTGEVFSFDIPPACERHNSISASDYPGSIDGTSLPIRGFGAPNLAIPDLDSSCDVHDPSSPPDTDSFAPVTRRRTSCGSTNPLIEIVEPKDLPISDESHPERTAPSCSDSKCLAPHPISKKPSRRRSLIKDVNSLVTVKMVYNEYGELVEEKDLTVRPKSDELSVKQLLRVIKKAYHHEVCAPRSGITFILLGMQKSGADDLSFETKLARSLLHAPTAKLRCLSMMVSGQAGSHPGISEVLAHRNH